MPTSRPRSTGYSSRSRAHHALTRRRAIAALAAGALLPSAVARAASGTPRLLAWGERGLWVVRGADGAAAAVDALSDEPLGTPPPLALAQRVVAIDGAGRLRGWQLHPEGWREQPPRVFDAPVHALGASADGQWTLVAHGQALSLLDAGGRVERQWMGHDLAQRRQGAAAAIRHLPQRRSFVVAWPSLGELWELQLDPSAPVVFDGLVHDYRMGEGLGRAGFLGIRRTPLAPPVPSLDFSDARVAWVAGRAGPQVAVVHLDVRRRIASLPFAEARPDGAALVAGGTARQWWLPVADTVQVLDPSRWEVLERHALAAPVHAVVAASAAVWVRVDDAQAPLRLWRDRRWQRPAADVAEALRALAPDATASTLLCAGSDRVWELDAQGRVARAWRFDAGAALRGVAAFPA